MHAYHPEFVFVYEISSLF